MNGVNYKSINFFCIYEIYLDFIIGNKIIFIYSLQFFTLVLLYDLDYLTLFYFNLSFLSLERENMAYPFQFCNDNSDRNIQLLKHSDVFEHQVFEPIVHQLVVRLNSPVRNSYFLSSVL